jgi:imidazole glycerol-phosphate synthase subunit HisH
MIGILDYGLSNIKSVAKALDYLGQKYLIVDEKIKFGLISKLIIPGVGSFKLAYENIEKKKYLDDLKNFVVEKKKPVLGICLGMQLLYSCSEEDGGSKGLNFIPGEVTALKKMNNLKINNVGWKKIIIKKKNLLLKNINNEDAIFYFVHRYACYSKKKNFVSASLSYDNKCEFDVIVEWKNIFATQFHPEKSQKAGLKVLENFISFHE